MAKQVQEAYIVAATRTPIGRSHRGFFRNMRPDDLLATTLKAALAAAPVRQVICTQHLQRVHHQRHAAFRLRG